MNWVYVNYLLVVSHIKYVSFFHPTPPVKRCYFRIDQASQHCLAKSVAQSLRLNRICVLNWTNCNTIITFYILLVISDDLCLSSRVNCARELLFITWWFVISLLSPIVLKFTQPPNWAPLLCPLLHKVTDAPFGAHRLPLNGSHSIKLSMQA